MYLALKTPGAPVPVEFRDAKLVRLTGMTFPELYETAEEDLIKLVILINVEQVAEHGGDYDPK